MNSQAKPGDKHQMILEVEIPVAEMQLALRQASRKIANQVNIPGFRKGKAPQSVLEGFVGAEAILEEASQQLVPQAYVEALQVHALEPVAQPELEITQLKKDEPLLFTATVTVKPEVKLGQYKGLELKKKTYRISDEDVDEELEKTRQRVAKLVEAPADAVVENGDNIALDFKGFVGGEAFDGGEAQNYPLEVGSHSFIPGFEEQLIGLKREEEKELTVTFPEEYHEKKLAGQDATFQVQVHSIKRKELPELNDAFAQEVSETADTLEQLRAETRAKLQENFDNSADEACRATGVQEAIHHAEVDLPQVMIENRMDDYVDEFAQKLQSQGLNLDMYLTYAKTTKADLREQYRVQAEAVTKMDLVLEAIAKEENIQVTEEDLNRQIEAMAAKYWQTPDQVRQTLEASGNLPYIEDNIKLVKAGQLIYENAQITLEDFDRKAALEDIAAAHEKDVAAQAEADAADEQ